MTFGNRHVNILLVKLWFLYNHIKGFPYMEQEVSAMMRGMDKGKYALSGIVPSGQSVGGAPGASIDHLAPLFRQAFDVLGQLSNALYKSNAQPDADRIVKLALEVNKVSNDRAKRKAENAVAGESSPVAKVGQLNAMGIPQGA